MYACLLAYTRCFERYILFKAEMGLKWNEGLEEKKSEYLDPEIFCWNLEILSDLVSEVSRITVTIQSKMDLQRR